MKKILQLVGGGVLVAAGVGASHFLLKDVQQPEQKTAMVQTEKAYTSQELLDQEYQFKKARRENGYAKADKPNEYTKFQNQIRTKWGQKQPSYQSGYKLVELNKAKLAAARSGASARKQALEWVERGPANVPGRTRGLVVLPGDATKNTWLAGSVAGGVWKTTDGGNSWVNKTPELPNMATTSIVTSAANPSVVYAGTGESFAGYNGVNGDGIFKSTDGGETWSQLAATAKSDNFRNINRLLVNQSNADVLVATTSPSYWGDGLSKIMKSTDGGATWQKVYESPRAIEQVVAHPTDFNIQYATVNGEGVIKSTDAGQTWQPTGNMNVAGRIEIAIAPSNPNRLFASMVGNASGTPSGVYVTDDAGASWSLVASLTGGTEYDYLGGQGWYDNTLAVNPYNANEVYVAGVNMFRIRVGEGGQTAPDIQSVELTNTESFLDFVNFSATHWGGLMNKGTNTDPALFRTAEIRFGTGMSQKAHRFTVPADGGSNGDGGAGIPATSYSYNDYVEVPFEVWDPETNTQLMVSFRDQERDGQFNLKDRQFSDEASLDNREYLYIHGVEYAETPSADIAKAAGQEVKQLYFFWPTLATDATWNPTALPTASMKINWGVRAARDREVVLVCDAYGSFGGPNGFQQTANSTEITGVHPDHHNIVMVPVDANAKTFKVLNANDGGVYVSKAGTEPGIKDGDWTFAGSGYNTTQFYGVDKAPGTDRYMGGTQDNGTWRSPEGESANATTKYLRALGGDGFEVLWHYDDPNKMMGTIYYNSILRSTNGGETWAQTNATIADKSETTAPFITKLASHKSKPDNVFAVGAQGVWYTTDFGGTWKLSPVADKWQIGSFTDVEVSQANPNIVWAGSGMSPAYNYHVSTDGGKTFEVTENYALQDMGVSTGIFTHPTEPGTAYALFSFANSPKILKTTDMGQTWTDISGFEGNTTSANGFPDVAAYTLMVMPHNPNQIWVGTEIGLVESLDGGATWAMANNGFPNVSIWDMKVVDDQVVVGSHARGIWSVTIPEIPAIIQSPAIQVAQAPTSNLTVELNMRGEYDSTIVMVNNQRITKLEKTTDETVSITLTGSQSGTAKVQAIGYVNNVDYPSNVVSYTLSQMPAALSAYQSMFDNSASDFVNNGFAVTTPAGFHNKAVHTKHNYEVATEYMYSLKVPVTVATENATFEYDDIALVEKGEAGVDYTNAAFKDYVVVEATKDGINWIALEPGYDASYNSKWSAAVDGNKSADRSMFVHHTIDLLNHFDAGDKVQFRFRLHSDNAGVAYGWVIDNLNIQGTQVLGFEEDVKQNMLAIAAYPNPVKDVANLKFYLPTASKVSFKVYDATGRIIDNVQLGHKPAGEHKFPYVLKGNSSATILIVEMQTKDAKRTVRILRAK